MKILDNRVCQLGEGPLWHPERNQLFWFDILGKRLLGRDGDRAVEWGFDEHVSAAGWVDHDTLVVASETGLSRFDLTSGTSELLVSLEADNPVTRSNDGRADPFGGFWIGTMGKNAEPGAGAIYRYFQGEIVRLYDRITISNAICFSPDRQFAYLTDTPCRRILHQPLDGGGWPEGDATVFVDLSKEQLNPDGAVVDADGCLWNAQWGAARVARYDPDGKFLTAVSVGVSQTSCPAFGGHDLSSLFVTSAAVGRGSDEAGGGKTFFCQTDFKGQPEHRVVLG